MRPDPVCQPCVPGTNSRQLPVGANSAVFRAEFQRFAAGIASSQLCAESAAPIPANRRPERQFFRMSSSRRLRTG